jgi:hypothetical protein
MWSIASQTVKQNLLPPSKLNFLDLFFNLQNEGQISFRNIGLLSPY